MARRVGARTVQDPLYPIQMYKQLFIQSSYLIKCIKNKTAFDMMTLEGHRGRVMAIKYHGDIVATGNLYKAREKLIFRFSSLATTITFVQVKTNRWKN